MSEVTLKLQEAMAHLQEEIIRLSDELYTQQREIGELRAYVRRLESRLEQAVLDAAGSAAPQDREPPPPHY